MTSLNPKFQEWTASQVQAERKRTFEHYEKLLHSVPQGLPEKDILEQFDDEELFTYIVMHTLIYFEDFFKGFSTVDGLPKRQGCIKRAMDNAKSHFKKTREEVIECFTKDWDTYNLI